MHGDSAALPFASGSFDFISCQYAFDHFRDKAGMLRETFRVLRRGTVQPSRYALRRGPASATRSGIRCTSASCFPPPESMRTAGRGSVIERHHRPSTRARHKSRVSDLG